MTRRDTDEEDRKVQLETLNSVSCSTLVSMGFCISSAIGIRAYPSSVVLSVRVYWLRSRAKSGFGPPSSTRPCSFADLVFTNGLGQRIRAAGERYSCSPNQPKHTMGDRSPKANQKKSAQKQSKTDGANQQKQNAAAAKAAARPAPAKKK